jgi:adenylate cyclase
MFSTYVNPQVVDTLLADPDKLKLGGEKTHATVFFSDIAGFTSISESLTPEALVELLNEYLTEMTGILLSYGGTLDKYIGDAVVGIFGAPIHFPEHAKNCCFCGLDMQAKIAEMRKVWKEQGKHQLQVRAGINTGDMIAGNMGSTKRFNYTVIGPEVDFGEHMESSGKLYNTQLTISEFTRAEADEHIITRFLDITSASAYPKPVKIYELLAKKSDGLPDNKMECAGLHSEGAALFFQRRFDEALAKLRKIHEIIPPNPEDEVIKKFLAPADKFIKRIEEAIKNPPDESFDTLIAEATHRKDLIF